MTRGCRKSEAPATVYRGVDCELVIDRVLIDTRVALGQVQRVARTLVVRLRVEVRRLHDQRVAFPVATGIAHPLTDGLGQVGAPVQGDDSRLVDQFLEHHDVIGILKDLVIAAIPTTDAIPSPGDAASPRA